ncbi:Retrovirus-related Pol polyprotein like [Argiope bruennichi]|uniref:Retrovirus-related Pol polyprotein like n=1 Tax=Argiope bruennichi TaxID=94029 RepID=A0A8T0FUV2_ARGBR|nr:Retrovirus-related Pol polyprotein like [Argiope bruennichi]
MIERTLHRNVYIASLGYVGLFSMDSFLSDSTMNDKTPIMAVLSCFDNHSVALPTLALHKNLCIKPLEGKVLDSYDMARNASYRNWRISFGVTNGVPAFQRNIGRIIKDEKLKGTFLYLDNVTVCGRDQYEHDQNLKRFLDIIKKYSLTINQDKCNYSTKCVKLLGYLIENKIIKPYPDRLAPMMSLPIPNNMATSQRTLGMFPHYCYWISRFSEKIRSFTKGAFPLSEEAEEIFSYLKTDIAEASFSAIEDNTPFRIEIDASEFAIGATLSQAERPVGFSRTLNAAEQRHPQ